MTLSKLMGGGGAMRGISIGRSSHQHDINTDDR